MKKTVLAWNRKQFHTGTIDGAMHLSAALPYYYFFFFFFSGFYRDLVFVFTWAFCFYFEQYEIFVCVIE